MVLDQVLDVLSEIKGCTFASIDCETEPSPGMRKLSTNEQVLLFTNQHISGYERMVRRRLEEIGKDPDSFVLSDMPWGERIPGTPLIKHESVKGDTYYLQVIVLKDGDVRAFIGPVELPPGEIPAMFLRDNSRRDTARAQGLDPERAVLVRSYNLKSIKEIRVLGDVLKA